MNLRTCAVIAFKFWPRAVLAFCIIFGLAIAASLLVKREYTASSLVLVKIGRELVYRPEFNSTAGQMETVDKDEIFASNIAIFKSASLIEEAINEIGIDRLYPDLVEPRPPSILNTALSSVESWLSIPEPTLLSKAANRFNHKLSVAVVKKTSLLDVSFTHPDPAMAAQVANLVVALFQQHVGSIYDNSNLQFEENQVKELQAGLETAENRLSAYRLSHNAFDLTDQLSLLLKQRDDTESKLNDTTAQIVQLEGLTAALRAQVAATPSSVPLYTETDRHRSIDDATTQLMQLQIQERQLATRFGENYPQLAEVRNQIKTAQAAVAAQSQHNGTRTRTGVNDVATTLQQSLLQNSAQLQSLSGMRDTLRGQIDSLNTSIAALSKTQPALAQLQRDVAQRTAAVKASYDKFIEARTVEGLNHEAPASFTVAEKAVTPDPADPSKPRPLLYMLMGIALGGFSGVVTLFLSFRTFGRFLTANQVARRLNRPVLAVIDYNASLASWKRNDSNLPRLVRPVEATR